MKITYINEAVRLPSKEQKNVTIDDIRSTNLPYIKAQIAKEINSELIACASKFEQVENMMIPAYNDENNNINFSLAINVETDLDAPGKFCVLITFFPQITKVFSKYNLFLTDRTFAPYVILNKLFKRIIKKHKEISKINIHPIWTVEYDSDIMRSYCGGVLSKQQLYDNMQYLQSHMLKSIQLCSIEIYFWSRNVNNESYNYLIKHTNDLFEFVERILHLCEISDDLHLIIQCDDRIIGSASECFESICNSNTSLKFSYASISDSYKMYKPFIFNSPNEILNIAKNKESFYIKFHITQLLNFVKTLEGKYIKHPESLMFLANIDYIYPDSIEDAIDDLDTSDANVEIIYRPIDSSFYIKYKNAEISIDTIVNYIIKENHIDLSKFLQELYDSQRYPIVRMIKAGISEVYDKIINEQSQ